MIPTMKGRASLFTFGNGGWLLWLALSSACGSSAPAPMSPPQEQAEAETSQVNEAPSLRPPMVHSSLADAATEEERARGVVVSRQASTTPSARYHPPPLVTVQSELGLPLEFLLDSAADLHLLWHPAFALLPGSHGDTAAVVADATGRSVVMPVVSEPAFTLAARVVEPIYHSGSVGLSSHGLAGALSPGVLSEQQPLQIDMRNGRLRFADERIPTTPNAEGTRSTCEGALFPKPRVSARIHGVELSLTLDTGASHTFISSSSLRGSPLAEIEPTEYIDLTTASGSMEAGAIGTFDVEVGSAYLPIEVWVTDTSASSCTDGVLGLDFLRHCIVDFEESRVLLDCTSETRELPTFDPAADRIAVSRVELEPRCPMRPGQLEAATHPNSPWIFPTWRELTLAAVLPHSQATEGALSWGAALEHRACRRFGEPVWVHHWSRAPDGLVLHTQIAAPNP